MGPSTDAQKAAETGVMGSTDPSAPIPLNDDSLLANDHEDDKEVDMMKGPHPAAEEDGVHTINQCDENPAAEGCTDEAGIAVHVAAGPGAEEAALEELVLPATALDNPAARTKIDEAIDDLNHQVRRVPSPGAYPLSPDHYVGVQAPTWERPRTLATTPTDTNAVRCRLP